MDTETCALCGTTAEFQKHMTIDGATCGLPGYLCPKCGKYVLTDGSRAKLDTIPTADRFKLACLFREHRLRGDKGWFGLFEDEFVPPQEESILRKLSRWWRLSELLEEFPKPTQMIDRALLNLSNMIAHPFGHVDIPRNDLQYLMFCPEHVNDMVQCMRRMDLLAGAADSRAGYDVQIAPEGWRRIEELRWTPSESRQAFVAMWFDPKLTPTYDEGIKPAIEAAGYEAKRVDRTEHNNKICDEIVAEIRRSRFLITDFTGQRAGVYFEAGYGMGMGVPVIWLVHESEVDKLHFDTRQYNHIVYTTNEDLREKLTNRIRATIH